MNSLDNVAREREELERRKHSRFPTRENTFGGFLPGDRVRVLVGPEPAEGEIIFAESKQSQGSGPIHHLTVKVDGYAASSLLYPHQLELIGPGRTLSVRVNMYREKLKQDANEETEYQRRQVEKRDNQLKAVVENVLTMLFREVDGQLGFEVILPEGTVPPGLVALLSRRQSVGPGVTRVHKVASIFVKWEDHWFPGDRSWKDLHVSLHTFPGDEDDAEAINVPATKEGQGIPADYFTEEFMCQFVDWVMKLPGVNG